MGEQHRFTAVVRLKTHRDDLEMRQHFNGLDIEAVQQDIEENVREYRKMNRSVVATAKIFHQCVELSTWDGSNWTYQRN